LFLFSDFNVIYFLTNKTCARYGLHDFTMPVCHIKVENTTVSMEAHSPDKASVSRVTQKVDTLSKAIRKVAVFWLVAPLGLVEVYRRFRGTSCLHHQGALMMEAESTSETSANFFQTTRRYNPEDSHLHTRRGENLKSN
jgi:hypothetical protein